ncbi:MAG: hypothetical protein QJR09_05165 [Micrococcus sp.]|nr:hypothetical protein [Micrococcus sp.]
MTENPIPGNDSAATAYFAAEQVPSRWAPETDAAVAVAYATLALAEEQRTANLIALEQLKATATGAAGRRGSAERIGARMQGPAEPAPAPDYCASNLVAIRFETLRLDVEKMRRDSEPNGPARAALGDVLALIDRHAAVPAPSTRGADQ